MTEATFVFAVVFACLLVLMPLGQVTVRKARLAQAFISLVGDRVDIAEEIALTGGVGPAPPEPEPSDRRPASPPTDQDKIATLELVRHGATLTATGTLGGDPRRPYALPFTPALVANGGESSLRWICSDRAPPGWTLVAAQGRSDLPDSLQFSVCRRPSDGAGS